MLYYNQGQFASYENQLNNVKISCEVLAKLVKQKDID